MARLRELSSPERRRVTTNKRSANEANLTDIIGAVSDLDTKGKMLSGRFCAMKLDRLPKYPPEETNVMAMMDRMRVVELQLNEVQDLSMRNRECIKKNATHICEVGSRNSGADKSSYSAMVSNSPVSQRVKKAVAVGVGTAGNGNNGVKKVIGGGTAVNVIGNTNAVGGGNDALESEIEYHVKDNGIVPRSVETVSHADAMYKSFKLTVSVNDMAKVLDADFWPEGYRTTQSSKWRESLTN